MILTHLTRIIHELFLSPTATRIHLVEKQDISKYLMDLQILLMMQLQL